MSRLAAALATLIASFALVLGVASPASAHVLPTTAVVLDVHEQTIDATMRIPLDDLETASGIDLGATPTKRIAAESARLRAYLVEHIRPTSTGGDWTVTAGSLAISSSEQLGTGVYQVLIAHVTLVAPSAASARAFTLHYDVVLDRVITHVAIVSVRTDWASGSPTSTTREIGTIQLDTVTGTVPALKVDLGAGSAMRGFISMIALGVEHIAEGTDHQLFLLTLLLPAPLLAGRRRWSGPTAAGHAIKRITAITLAFTVGHSVTLAMGAIGLIPVPQQIVEAMIAVSILVAAVHAIRPIFPGREPVVAGVFGLVHGMAFSVTLASLDLRGSELVLSLLGFNLGIELMQLAVVALVLPPLLVLSRSASYARLRVVASIATGIAASGWLVSRLGVPNLIATAADEIAPWSPWAAAALVLVAGVSLIRRSRARAVIRRERQDRVSAALLGVPSSSEPHVRLIGIPGETSGTMVR